MTVKEAFNQALNCINDEKMARNIWNGKEYDVNKWDLCIKPTLLAEGSSIHMNKLFDSNSMD